MAIVTGASRGIGQGIAQLFATEPLDKVAGRITCSQAILKEFGWIDKGKGIGIDQPGSGYSQQ